jgi:hypothetical protein
MEGRPLRVNTADLSLTLSAQSHHPRLPGEEEEREEREKASSHEKLKDEGNEKDPIKPRRSPNPVSDNRQDHERLDEHEKKVNRVRIVPLIVVRQPSARLE